MAGGMNRRGEHRPSLHERIHGTPPATSPAPVKRCWVDGRDGRVPGLLLEWRRTPSGWRGRVVYPVSEGASWAIVDEWLPAELLAAD